MNRFFLGVYAALFIMLLAVTPFDLEWSCALVFGSGGSLSILSEMGYLPVFFIGYFGIFYYCARFYPGLKYHILRAGLMVGVILGLALLTYMYVHSMRFLPHYLVLAFVYVTPVVMLAWWTSRLTLKHSLTAFDYLASVGLVMIVGLYFLVTHLKQVFGRARIYLVLENEDLFSPWYAIRGMVDVRDFYSIPSGHITFVAIAFWFVVVAFSIPAFKRHIKALITLVMLWTLFHGYLRVAMGQHYISDVFFSTILSLLLLHMLYYVSKHVRLFMMKRFGV